MIFRGAHSIPSFIPIIQEFRFVKSLRTLSAEEGSVLVVFFEIFVNP